jgi:cbb3-type cytochrome oxidase maturation protein
VQIAELATGSRDQNQVAVTLALFAAGIAMGIAGACMWAWGVHSGQFRDLEQTKHQVFWPDLPASPEGGARDASRAAPPGGKA